jgi:hypothetical protein
MKLILILLLVICSICTNAQNDTSNQSARRLQGETYLVKSKDAKGGAIVLLILGAGCTIVACAEMISSMNDGFLISNPADRKKADAASATGLCFTVASFGFYTWSFISFHNARKFKRKAEALLKNQTVYLPTAKGSSQQIAVGLRLNF